MSSSTLWTTGIKKKPEKPAINQRQNKSNYHLWELCNNHNITKYTDLQGNVGFDWVLAKKFSGFLIIITKIWQYKSKPDCTMKQNCQSVEEMYAPILKSGPKYWRWLADFNIEDDQ